jgi:ATP-dependent DNA helicase RecG|tara:strand:+ start:324 stop:2363 length:2040 start_codon:yes stop_codon:yes gene_type:complete
MNNYEYILSDISILKGVGKSLVSKFKRKNIHTIFDLILSTPSKYIDRSIETKIEDLHIGKIQTITIMVEKYIFPRIRKIPSKVICSDNTGRLECVFFNSYEGYIKKILPLNQLVTISGKITFFRGKYQITNPTHISTDKNKVKKIHSSYSLTDGISNNIYNKTINEAIKKLPKLDEWLSPHILNELNNISWNDAIKNLHKPKDSIDEKKYINRLIFDEILSTFIINSNIRRNFKKKYKLPKKIDLNLINSVEKKIGFKLTIDQINAVKQINFDIASNERMFRLLQGDVGSGKTIVSLIAAHSIISNKYQVAYMAPTEILAKQHYKLFSKVFGNSFYSEILTGKTEYKNKKNILLNLKNKKIDIIFGTHALFQKTIEFKKLGLIIIDEQHKFGVNQRKKLSEKGGSNCDVLIMSATPIPRTMMMTLYGDMDITLIKSKPKNRKEIKTYTKDINKIDDVINFLEKEVNNNNQIFWVCPLIEESKKLDHQSCIVRYEYLKKIFKNKIGLLHGSIDNDKKEEILNNFLNNKIKILVSTTIIEVGIDFPNATCIVIEDSNKFGLSQLHQLRGRVGRGEKQSSCILLYKSSLSENAKKRLKILKSSNNGFFIAEEDLKLRSYGDLLGFQQSGQKTFKLADPILNEDLFLLAEKEIKIIENEDKDLSKYNSLIKLYDRADIVNELI